jgi:hypothetical protein
MSASSEDQIAKIEANMLRIGEEAKSASPQAVVAGLQQVRRLQIALSRCAETMLETLPDQADYDQQRMVNVLTELFHLPWSVRVSTTTEHVDAFSQALVGMNVPRAAKLGDPDREMQLSTVVHLVQSGWTIRVSADQAEEEIDVIIWAPAPATSEAQHD